MLEDEFNYKFVFVFFLLTRKITHLKNEYHFNIQISVKFILSRDHTMFLNLNIWKLRWYSIHMIKSLCKLRGKCIHKPLKHS